ncbi:MAG TPA: type VI secretion system membrane subunit TssM [Blastocatellia bacterium]|nr:type VI secretion system membrane subunit TssM [Blastocatellia bacterium]
MPVSDPVKSVITTAALVASYGIGIGLIWLVLGPVLALSPATQIALTALLLATWPLAILISWFARRRQNDNQPATSNGKAQSARPAAAQSLGAARAYPALETNAEEAAQWLRANWRGQTVEGDALYGLPWFLVVGPALSGKTSLLLSAGLDFNALPSQMRAEQMQVRRTRDCEWRVTGNAVLLDTTGRYMTEGPDRDEWLGLLETLRKYRAARPFDGLLVVVSAKSIIESDEREIEKQAKVIRDRIDEARALTQLRFPVYLIFTHADALEGFGEFFRTLSPGERSQVWGATIRLDRAQNAHALFDGYCDELYARLARQRLYRMSKPEAAAGKAVTRLLSPEQLQSLYSDQLRVFEFPFRFGGARRKLSLFSSALFRPNPFSENPLFRGFYFTSSLPAFPNGQQAAAQTGELNAPGRGWFTEVLFKDVLQRDRKLTAAFQPPSHYPKLLRRVLLGVAAVTLVFLLAGMLISYFRNRELIATGERLGLEVTRVVKVAKKNEPATIEEVKVLNDLREFLSAHETAPDLFYRLGLYSGPAISAPLRTIYFDAISQRFFVPAVEAIEKKLRDFNAQSEPPKNADEYYGQHYDLLKAYLMFSQPGRVEPVWLENTLADYWKATAPAADTEERWRELLRFYAQHAGSEDAPHWKPDSAIVEKVRGRLLASYPPENRYYKIITDRINRTARPMTLETIIGESSEWLKSSHIVPGSYTIDGYYDNFRAALGSAAKEILEDDWVLGQSVQKVDIGKMQKMYLRDYTAQWQSLLRGLIVPQFKEQKVAEQALRDLSGSDSPLAQVMRGIAEQTSLASPKSRGFFSRIFASASGGKDTAALAEVDREFAPLAKFVEGGDKAAVIKYLDELRSLQQKIERTDLRRNAAAAGDAGSDAAGLKTAEQNIDKLTDSFKTEPTKDAAVVLKQPLQRVRELIDFTVSGDNVTAWSRLAGRLQNLQAGYPFIASDTRFAQINDLTALLSPVSGALADFTAKRLSAYVDNSQGEWQKRKADDPNVSQAVVDYLRKVERLREALFPNRSAEIRVEYDLTLQNEANGPQIVIEVDGTRVDNLGSRSARSSWPARPGSPTGAKITVTRPDGTSTPREFPGGSWGLFKMFEQGSPRKVGSQYQLAWPVGGVTVRAVITPASATHPFDRSLFTQMPVPVSLK